MTPVQRSQDPAIDITWDDLASADVEETLRERQAVERTQEHYQTAAVPGAVARIATAWGGWWRRGWVYLTCFGVIGGILAGAACAVVVETLSGPHDRAAEARALLRDLADLDAAEADGRLTPAEALSARAQITFAGTGNAYFEAHTDPALNDRASERRTAAVYQDEARRTRRARVATFAVIGLCLASTLAAADPLVGRDRAGATRNAAVAGVVGALCGAGVAAGFDLLPGVGFDPEWIGRFGHVVTHATLGLGVAAATGLTLGSLKRLAPAIVGGTLAGGVGGFLLPFVSERLGTIATPFVTTPLIGGLIGLSLAVVEEAAKDGWLKVATGPIAGKQFVLYRDPTFIGSAPLSHIYLFRDALVGRRHAAIHRKRTAAGGWYELENLPPGGPTLVNGKPVKRVRLIPGDRVAVGRTVFVFDEKRV